MMWPSKIGGDGAAPPAEGVERRTATVGVLSGACPVLLGPADQDSAVNAR
ncbi:hypothetical protein SAMN06265355_102117 [Actinomadura mexicana]|uniref:Uncharacterized protein n=1 Tax=Actinomadura mexicana TaxID=134959 RepID=A0A238VNR4_9ACTN|nr:hypothetical protein SAMN06265355_102117 [Actinomadura mexicana]